MKRQLARILGRAGEMMLGRGDFSVEQKAGHANYVTTVDKAVEEYLQEELLRLLPGSVLIGEEQKNEPLTDAPTWVVDPIDGTTNFIHNYRASAVSVALEAEALAAEGKFTDAQNLLPVYLRPPQAERLRRERAAAP